MKFDPHSAWYLSRASGLVAWALLTLSLVSGALFSAKTRYPKGAWTLAVHRHLSVLALTSTAAHCAVLVFDGYLKPTFVQLLIPGQFNWHPFEVALGQIAFYLLCVVQVSGLVKAKLSARMFRTLHLLAIPSWVAATWHYLSSGSDASHMASRAMAALGVVAVVASFSWRTGAAAGRQGRRRPAATHGAPTAEAANGTLSETAAQAAGVFIVATPSPFAAPPAGPAVGTEPPSASSPTSSTHVRDRSRASRIPDSARKAAAATRAEREPQ